MPSVTSWGSPARSRRWIWRPPASRAATAHQTALFYSDLWLQVVQGVAGGRDWRTTPLWGLSARRRLLHNGRARTLTEAILAHSGEAATARQRFRDLSPADREALLAFLSGL